MFAAVCPDNVLHSQDLLQCQKEKWIPVAVLNQDKTTLFCFKDQICARNFAKRNFPGQLIAVVGLGVKEWEWIKTKGWEVEILNFPKLYKDVKGFGYEILEFSRKPDLGYNR